jgi:hypothetical protein
MKNINTLIPDIYSLVQSGGGWFHDELAKEFSTDIGLRLQRQLGENEVRNRLSISRLGPSCPRALWYSVHRPELSDPLPAWARIKYSYGHILEGLVTTLAKAAGHEVTGEQDELYLDGIVGHRDCVLDGYVVDVKSASSVAFQKFKAGSFEDNFGYLDQLDGYCVASMDDPLVRHRDVGYLLVIDKQLGHMCLYKHRVREDHVRQRARECKEIVAKTSPPSCECKVVPYGKAGNLKLDTKASYSPFKYQCFPHLRTFIYSGGPVYLSKVVKVPDVKEVFH